MVEIDIVSPSDLPMMPTGSFVDGQLTGRRPSSTPLGSSSRRVAGPECRRLQDELESMPLAQANVSTDQGTIKILPPSPTESASAPLSRFLEPTVVVTAAGSRIRTSFDSSRPRNGPTRSSSEVWPRTATADLSGTAFGQLSDGTSHASDESQRAAGDCLVAPIDSVGVAIDEKQTPYHPNHGNHGFGGTITSPDLTFGRRGTFSAAIPPLTPSCGTSELEASKERCRNEREALRSDRISSRLGPSPKRHGSGLFSIASKTVYNDGPMITPLGKQTGHSWGTPCDRQQSDRPSLSPVRHSFGAMASGTTSPLPTSTGATSRETAYRSSSRSAFTARAPRGGLSSEPCAAVTCKARRGRGDELCFRVIERNGRIRELMAQTEALADLQGRDLRRLFVDTCSNQDSHPGKRPMGQAGKNHRVAGGQSDACNSAAETPAPGDCRHSPSSPWASGVLSNSAPLLRREIHELKEERVAMRRQLETVQLELRTYKGIAQNLAERSNLRRDMLDMRSRVEKGQRDVDELKHKVTPVDWRRRSGGRPDLLRAGNSSTPIRRHNLRGRNGTSTRARELLRKVDVDVSATTNHQGCLETVADSVTHRESDGRLSPAISHVSPSPVEKPIAIGRGHMLKQDARGSLRRKGPLWTCTMMGSDASDEDMFVSIVRRERSMLTLAS